MPDNDYRRFIRERVGPEAQQLAGGAFVDSTGRELGRHRGYPFYTIGQRRGLGLALGFPAYVTAIDPGRNEITVGPVEDLEQQHLVAREFNAIQRSRLDGEVDAVGKIRYNDPGSPCVATQIGDAEISVTFAGPRRAITPGQAVVLYDGDDVLGGAWIHSVPEQRTPMRSG